MSLKNLLTIGNNVFSDMPSTQKMPRSGKNNANSLHQSQLSVSYNNRRQGVFIHHWTQNVQCTFRSWLSHWTRSDNCLNILHMFGPVFLNKIRTKLKMWRMKCTKLERDDQHNHHQYCSDLASRLQLSDENLCSDSGFLYWKN